MAWKTKVPTAQAPMRYAAGLVTYQPNAPVGNVYYVHHSGSNSAGRGFTPDAPLATIDYAVGLCTANNDDKIVVLPGHAETLTGAGGITLDVAGVEVIGLGHKTQRPTITLGHTAATILVTAANVQLRNLRITCSVDEVVNCITVSAAGLLLDAVDYVETATFQLIQFLLTTAAADDLTIRNCRHVQATAAAAAQLWIQLIGADRAHIHDNFFCLTLNDAATSAVITCTGTASLGIEIARNAIVMTGYSANLLSAILLLNGTTGLTHDNRIAANVAANTTINSGGNAMYHAENYCTNAVDTSGILDPVADT